MSRITRNFMSVAVMTLLLITGTRAQWTQTNGPDGGFILSLGVKGQNIFAGTHGARAYRSTNDGSTWTPSFTNPISPHVYDFLVSGTNLFAACPGDGGVSLSTDNGDSWAVMNSGLFSTEVYSLAGIDTDLFAATMGGGVFRSTDNGANWTPANPGLGSLSVWVIRAQGGNLFAGTYGNGAYLSP